MATKETKELVKMIMRSRPEMNLNNPPGQVKYQEPPPSRGTYLRDIIKRIQREEFDEQDSSTHSTGSIHKIPSDTEKGRVNQRGNNYDGSAMEISKATEAQEIALGARNAQQAVIPSTDAEKLYSALLGALAAYLESSKGSVVSGARVRNDIRKLLNNFT